jgi:hypothetical protein
MEDLLIMTRCNCVAHLREHGRNEAETIRGQDQGRMWMKEETASRRYCMFGGRIIMVVMITGLFQEIKQVLARNKSQEKK